ncbi:MAG: hypothetical protein R6V50_07085 [Thermoplasmatota archaeon]
MKKHLVIGSIMVVFLLMVLPTINAVEAQSTQHTTRLDITYAEIKNMDTKELIAFILELSEEYPELNQEFEQMIKELDASPYESLLAEEISEDVYAKDDDSQPVNNNQTMLERLFWRIFKYRLFRLYICTAIFLFTQSKISLYRTTTWAIKLLRLVKIGIILGFIDPSTPDPETPSIEFMQDTTNNSLTVISVKPDNLLWGDIKEIGSGSCDPLPSGTVMVGDQITNCTDIIVLRHTPSNTILGVFDFP